MQELFFSEFNNYNGFKYFSSKVVFSSKSYSRMLRKGGMNLGKNVLQGTIHGLA